MKQLFGLLLVVSVLMSCSKDADNEKFIGIFAGLVDCEDGDEGIATTLNITAQANSETDVNIVLTSDGEVVLMTGTATGTTLEIDAVKVEDDTFLSGIGTINGDELTVTFTVLEGTEGSFCIFTGKR